MDTTPVTSHDLIRMGYEPSPSGNLFYMVCWILHLLLRWNPIDASWFISGISQKTSQSLIQDGFPTIRPVIPMIVGWYPVPMGAPYLITGSWSRSQHPMESSPGAATEILVELLGALPRPLFSWMVSWKILSTWFKMDELAIPPCFLINLQISVENLWKLG